MDPMRSGAKLLSRGMRDANGALTLIGALLVFRSILKWLEGPKEELVYTRTLRRGESIKVGLTDPEA